MSDTSKPFAFSQFVPGFDFLKNLASGSATVGATPGMPSLASWVAPTLSVEEVDKRIQELKTVQFWLEQNGHALKATIQALEVQRMTLSTLRGMNVQMEDLASVFTRQAAATPAFKSEAPAPAPKVEPKKAERVEEPDEPEEEASQLSSAKPSKRARNGGDGSAASGDEAGVVDPLQWWGALTQQFQQIASAALQEASQLKMPTLAQTKSDTAVATATSRSAKKPAATSKSSAAGRRASAAGKTPPPARKRAR